MQKMQPRMQHLCSMQPLTAYIWCRTFFFFNSFYPWDEAYMWIMSRHITCYTTLGSVSVWLKYVENVASHICVCYLRIFAQTILIWLFFVVYWSTIGILYFFPHINFFLLLDSNKFLLGTSIVSLSFCYFDRFFVLGYSF